MAEPTWGDQESSVERMTLPGYEGAAVEAIHAWPDGSIRLGLVVGTDLGGPRPRFEELARRIASNGIAVCIPDLFAHAPDAVREDTKDMSAPGAGTLRLKYLPNLRDSVVLGDFAAAANFLRRKHLVERVAVLGFCLGGMYAFKAAASGEFDRAAVFYGPIRVPEPWLGAETAHPVANIRDVCPTIAVFCGTDRWTPEADMVTTRQEWAARPDCEVVYYPDQVHGFAHLESELDPARLHGGSTKPSDSIDADGSEAVWDRVIEFLLR